MLLRPLRDAREFVRRAAHLGVDDVFSVGASGVIYVALRADVDADRAANVRVLAKIRWPDHQIVIGPRVALRDSRVELDSTPDAATDDDVWKAG
jgi:hypothetical protein